MQSLVVFGWLEKAVLLPIYYLYSWTWLEKMQLRFIDEKKGTVSFLLYYW
jgi:hypothetical protein